MKRPMLVLGISCAIATWASFLLPSGWLLPLSAGCAALSLPGYMLRERRRAYFALFAALLAAAAALGLRWHHQQTQILPLEHLEGRRVLVEGVVTGITPREGTADYLADVRFPEEEHLPRRSTLLLRSYDGAALLPGDAFVCRVTVRTHTGSSLYNQARGAFVRGNLVLDTLEITPTGPFEFTRLATNLREGMSRKLALRLDRGTAALLQGMLLGQRDGLGNDQIRALDRSGASHLLAVSGLHLSILTGLLLSLLTALGCPPRLRHAAAVLGGFCFAGLVGFSPSVFRAFVMLGVYHLVCMLSATRRSDTLNSLGLSLLLIALLFPHWTLSTGVWLSAASTAGIALWAGGLNRFFGAFLPPPGTRTRRLAAPFASAFATTLATYPLSAPILMLVSGGVSLVAPLVNLLLTPLIPLILGGGMLLAALPMAWGMGPIALVVRVCAGLLLRVAGLFAALPFAFYGVDHLYQLVWGAGALGILYLTIRLRPRRAVCLWTAGACCLCLLLGGASFRAGNRHRIEAAALEGCGQLVLLREGDAVILGTPSQYEIGILLRYLDYRGIHTLSAVVATDFDGRVGSGLLRLAERYEIGCVFGPDDDFALGQLKAALPGQEVRAMADNTYLFLLEGAWVSSRLDGLLMHTQVGAQQVVRYGAEPDLAGLALIPFLSENQVSVVDAGGALYWADDAPPWPEPLGALLFGETRLSLSILGYG